MPKIKMKVKNPRNIAVQKMITILNLTKEILQDLSRLGKIVLIKAIQEMKKAKMKRKKKRKKKS